MKPEKGSDSADSASAPDKTKGGSASQGLVTDGSQALDNLMKSMKELVTASLRQIVSTKVEDLWLPIPSDKVGEAPMSRRLERH